MRRGSPSKRAQHPTPAKYLGVSKMTLWWFKHVAGFDFPVAAVINNIEFNDLDKVDAWMEARVPSAGALS